MALGGVLVVAMLAGASVYVPHHIRAHAGSSVAQPPAHVAPELAAQPASTQPAEAPENTSAVKANKAAPNVAPPATAAPTAQPKQDDAAAAARAEAERQAQEEAARRAEELKDAEHEADQLSARASAISQSLDNLRQQQQSLGYGLRGDMAAAEDLMKTNLSRAQAALDQQDGAKAKEYLSMAEAQAEKLEHFLGR
jgi:hypothetical protein